MYTSFVEYRLIKASALVCQESKGSSYSNTPVLYRPSMFAFELVSFVYHRGTKTTKASALFCLLVLDQGSTVSLCR